MNTPIDFWFDFSSPYSYIANEWIDAIAARHGRTVQRRAILAASPETAMKKTVKSMVDEAMAAITTYSVEEARELHGLEDVQFVDLRDVRELERDGVIPGAFHAPRGMLEFWVDPESPYHKPVFNRPGTRYVLFCAAGWRSALATRTMQEMGIGDVGHIDGGFEAWRKSGAPVGERKRKPAP